MDTSQTSINRACSAPLADNIAPIPNDSIAVLHQFACDLIATPDLNEVLRKALLAAAQLTGAQHATLLLLDDLGTRICYRIALDNGNLAPLELVAKPMMSKGLAGWVVRAHSTALVHDIELDQRWLPGPGLGDLRSAIVTPLMYADQVLGILTLASELPGHYQSEHVRLIEILGAQAASAIKLARTRMDPAPARAQDAVALAAELRGLSAAAARLAPEIGFDDVLRAYIQTNFTIIHRYNGIILNTADDTLLALFEASGGGALAAARAALALQSAAQELCADWHRRISLRLGPLTIGIARGMALLGQLGANQPAYHAIGAVIGQAVRLRALARSSEILVADDLGVALSAADDFMITALPPLHLSAAATQNIYRLRPARAPIGHASTLKPPDLNARDTAAAHSYQAPGSRSAPD